MSNDSTKHDLVITHTFDAPIERVWEAWATADDIKQWWGPDGFTAPFVNIDFREGGTSLLCMSSPQHGEHYSIWDYKTIVPMEQIEYVHNLADKNGVKVDPVAVGMPDDFPTDQRHTIDFKAKGDNQTQLTVTEYGWTVGQMMEMSKMGMNQCLDKMAKLFVEDE